MRFQPKTDPIIQKPICVSKNGSVPLKTDPFPPKTVVLDPISRGFFSADDMGLAFHERAFTFGRFNGQSRRVFSNGACNETHTFRHARVQLVAITRYTGCF